MIFERIPMITRLFELCNRIVWHTRNGVSLVCASSIDTLQIYSMKLDIPQGARVANLNYKLYNDAPQPKKKKWAKKKIED